MEERRNEPLGCEYQDHIHDYQPASLVVRLIPQTQEVGAKASKMEGRLLFEDKNP